MPLESSRFMDPDAPKSDLWRSQLVLLIVLAFAGCGPAQVETYPVSGSVKFSNGQPVRSGTVELQSLEHGTTATGTIREDGSFTLGTYSSDDGAAAGQHKAIVVQLIIGDGISVHHRDHAGRSDTLRRLRHSNLTAEVQPNDDNRLTLTIESNSR